MRGPRSPDQFDPKDDNRQLGAHERSSFQQKDRPSNPSYQGRNIAIMYVRR